MICTSDDSTKCHRNIYSVIVDDAHGATHAITITRCIEPSRDDDRDHSTMIDSKAVVEYFKINVLWRYLLKKEVFRMN